MKRLTWAFAFLACCGISHAQTIVREWRAEDLAKWHRGLVKNARVADGALHFETEAGDSMLVSPAFEAFPATPWQRVELTMKSDTGGPCDLFWSGTTKSKYGGFWPTKRTGFHSKAGDFHTYIIEPFWQAEKKIVLLRLDFPHDKPGCYAVKSLRVVDTAPPTVTALPARDPTPDADGEWRARVSVRAEEAPFVSVRMAVSAGQAGVVSFASSERNGMRTISFPLRADGRMHTYNVDASSGAGWEDWRGEIIALRLRPTDAKNATVKIESISAEADLTGPPDLEVAYFALADAFARAGRPVRLEAMVRNHGAESACGVKAKLKLAGARLLKEEAAPSEIEYGQPATFAWTVRADSPGKAKATLEICDLPAMIKTLEFKRPLRLPKAVCVPKPKPARSDYQVGVYYFPGWNTAAAWSRIKPYPERQPLLGWYREGDPEVADWQIKWAVEHGISFFLYDWYWNRGARHLEHGLHDALFKARYQHLLKFCLLYANHNPPGSHSAADWEAITRYWIENYFRRPNYLRVEGKPVVVIFSSLNPSRDMGDGLVSQTFDRMRAMCRDAGVGGLYLVACSPPTTALLARFKALGYDAVTAYNWPSINMTPAEKLANRAPFATCLEGFRAAWNDIAAANIIKLIPPVCGGWDARPWHGEATLARTGRTPALFKQHLLDCKRFLDQQEQPPKLRMLFIEAWNEWGEGSYIEPHREFGFGYLEAIRQVFAPRSPKPAEIVPADIGLGPYDVAETPLTTTWDFTQAADPLGWTGNVGNLRIEAGALRFVTQGRDPILTSPPMNARASRFPFIVLRVQSSRDIGGQLFWTKPGVAAHEAASVHFPIKGDGRFHDIKVRVADNPRWRGFITGLRFDPGSDEGVEVAVEAIRLSEK